MRHILNILLFFVYCSGLGYLFVSFVRRNDPGSFLLQIAVGLAGLPLIGILLHIVHVPIDARIILGLSLIGLFIFIKRTFPRLTSKKSSRKKARLWILLAIFLIQAFIYCGGAFRYPYLEDDDSWGHAAGIKYIAIEKKLSVEPGQFHYLNPYPPGYAIVFGLLHQTHPSLYWTMKFFNGLIISLGFLFFFGFAKELTGEPTKALLATLVLSMTPCYLSHFIWAHALAVTLFFPALTCLLKCRNDRSYILPGTVLLAGIFLTQPTQSLKLSMLVGLLVLAIILSGQKGTKNILAVCVAAGLVSLLWWGPVLHSILSGSSKIALRDETNISGYHENTALVARNLFAPDGGSATRAYSFKDYFLPRTSGQLYINNPLGLGAGISLFALLGVFFLAVTMRRGPPQLQVYVLTILFWLIFTFLGMNSATFRLPAGLFAFRFWMLFAVPVAFLAVEGFLGIHQSLSSKMGRNLFTAFSVLILLVFSGYPKLAVNTSFWPGGEYWHSTRELRGYVWMRSNLKPGTRVFSFSDNLLVIGHDMRCDFWTDEYKDSFRQAFQMPPAKLHDRLKSQKFEYMIVGLREMKRFGWETTNIKLQELENSGLFKTVYTLDNGVVVFRLV